MVTECRHDAGILSLVISRWQFSEILMLDLMATNTAQFPLASLQAGSPLSRSREAKGKSVSDGSDPARLRCLEKRRSHMYSQTLCLQGPTGLRRLHISFPFKLIYCITTSLSLFICLILLFHGLISNACILKNVSLYIKKVIVTNMCENNPLFIV